MKSMKVLLRQKVEHLGGIGDSVSVAPGYARNYLLPRKMATQATEDNIRAMQRRRERYEADLVAREAEINARIEALPLKTNTVSNTAFRGFGGPQGMVACERFGAEDVQSGARDVARVEQRQQIVVDHMGAARDIDQMGAPR